LKGIEFNDISFVKIGWLDLT